jgi:hypothetical protein
MTRDGGSSLEGWDKGHRAWLEPRADSAVSAVWSVQPGHERASEAASQI